MTGPVIPPPKPVAPQHSPEVATAPISNDLPTTRPSVALGALGKWRVGHSLASAVAVLVLVLVAKSLLHTDPVKQMTDDLYRVGAAETAYRGTHSAFTGSLLELQRLDRKLTLHSQLVQFEAGKNGYQIVVRNSNSIKQCTLIAGSFKPIGGPPEVTCADVPAPK